jgi:hypothetical protein
MFHCCYHSQSSQLPVDPQPSSTPEPPKDKEIEQIVGRSNSRLQALLASLSLDSSEPGDISVPLFSTSRKTELDSVQSGLTPPSKEPVMQESDESPSNVSAGNKAPIVADSTSVAVEQFAHSVVLTITWQTSSTPARGVQVHYDSRWYLSFSQRAHLQGPQADDCSRGSDQAVQLHG